MTVLLAHDRHVHGTTLSEMDRQPAVARVRRVLATVIDRGVAFHPGEMIVVACSGGPDSTALLDALHYLSAPRGLGLAVAYVNHRLRPEAVTEGEQVIAAARARDLPAMVLTITVQGAGSLQARAREARYAALRDHAAALGATAIALGHTADDQAETVLMRALAGATPRALSAMRLRAGMLVRPLLSVWREETVEYCRARGLTVVHDPSNVDPRYLRVAVRQQLLPQLERVFPKAKSRLVALARHQQRLLDSIPDRREE